MGTTLTGTAVKDTYDSLIKVTDNGPIGATAKYLSDGLGNDSILALSTARVGVGTTGPSENLHVVGNVLASDNFYIGNSNKRLTQNGNDIRFWNRTANDIEFLTNDVQRLVVKGAGNVGIGTSSPSTALAVNGALQSILGSGGVSLSGNASPDLGYVGYNYYNVSGTETAPQTIRNSWRIKFGNGADKGITFDYRAANDAAGTFTEYVRIQETGGISFNGDTAAANALDDYEEGTWTGTLRGTSSDPSTAVTATGYYTKIGRQVTATISITGANTTGASGAVRISGLPFNAAASISNYGSVVTEFFDFGTNRTSLVSRVAGSAASTEIWFYTSGDDVAYDVLLHNAGTGRFIETTITYFV